MSKDIYTPYDRFLLRSPILPVEEFDKLSEDYITELIKNNLFQEAIFLASPDLYNKIERLLKGELKEKQDIEKLNISLFKYLSRMSSRCTPFGTFAGCSIGKISEENCIFFSDMSLWYKHTRLDMNYLCALASDIAKHPNLGKTHKLWVNSSLYYSGKNIRYVEYKYYESTRFHEITSVPSTEYLKKILQMADGGANQEELIQSIISEEISYQEAADYITELIESQILVSDIEPTVTGQEFLPKIINFKTTNNIDSSKLVEVDKKLKELRNLPGEIGSYYYIENIIKDIGTKYDLKFLFQSDLFKKTEKCEINEEIATSIATGIDILTKLNIKSNDDVLSKFKERFIERYEEREVPLVNVLDIESGIGFIPDMDIEGDSSDLLDSLFFPKQKSSHKDELISPIHTTLLEKYHDAIVNHKKEIELSEDDVDFLPKKNKLLPPSVSAIVELIIEKGIHKACIGGIMGLGAANLLSRFGHGNIEIENYIKDIAQKEEELEKALIAEIVHLPEARTGNVLLRPTIHKYEIPYLAKSSVDREFQININDLMLSIKNDRIILRSKKLDREIIPRLTNAHNYVSNSLPIYQFLATLSTQDYIAGTGFNFGTPFSYYKFLPRVSYKNVILYKATWYISKKELESVHKPENLIERMGLLNSFRENKGIPFKILLLQGDNKLLLNLERPLDVKVFLNEVKKLETFTLQEFIHDNTESFVKGKNGNYTNEFIFSFYKDQK